jgi:hypothetical protein
MSIEMNREMIAEAKKVHASITCPNEFLQQKQPAYPKEGILWLQRAMRKADPKTVPPICTRC